QPPLQPASGQQAASAQHDSPPKARVCPISELMPKTASPINPKRYFFMFNFSCYMRWKVRPKDQNEICTSEPKPFTLPGVAFAIFVSLRESMTQSFMMVTLEFKYQLKAML